MLDLSTSIYAEMVLPSHVFTLIRHINPWINSRPHGTVDPVSSPNGPIICLDVVIPIPGSLSTVTIQATKMAADGATVSILANINKDPLFYGIVSINDLTQPGTLKLCNINATDALSAIASKVCEVHSKSKFIQTWRD